MTRRDVDAERLALLLEGKLSADDRAKLVAELEQSPELREAFADAAAVLDEVAPNVKADAKPVIPIRSAPSRRQRFTGFAIAAGLVLALAVPVTRWVRRSNDFPEPSAVVAMLASSAVSRPLTAEPWRELRGAGQALPVQARAVRIGALIADLEVASIQHDTGADRIAARIGSLANEYPGGSVAGDTYRALTSASDASTRGEARRTMETLVGSRELRLGAWLETARLAAAAHDSSFFASTVTRSALRIAASMTSDQPAGRDALTRLSNVLATPTRDWSAISAETDRLLAALADSR